MTASMLFLTDGPYRLAVDTKLGGHIVEFSIDGHNALAEGKPEIGSTFWPSPQNAWGWPPPYALDKGPYEIVASDAVIRIMSPICPQTQLRLEKSFRLQNHSLMAVYTLRNCGEVAVQYAPWEITRVAGGITFYESALPALRQSTGKLVLQDGIAWHQYKPEEQTQNEKIFGNGSRGWLANVNEGLLLVKQFEPVPVELVAPGEAEVEIYGHGDCDNAYIEIEQQGRYEVMPPDCELQWQVIWRLRRWTEHASVGSANMVNAVRQLIANGD